MGSHAVSPKAGWGNKTGRAVEQDGAWGCMVSTMYVVREREGDLELAFSHLCISNRRKKQRHWLGHYHPTNFISQQNCSETPRPPAFSEVRSKSL